ncbi:S-adenosyl-L-methionine-dependent methyltransferases superfamily protein isoform 1 [Hibiscus syriacus]|uniref:S-adenosyl-L-methionine-dependent methyltransferases superfamily protein isoform 1 n=1 Tax=Hibiscus syriacus TaxID=106335 RepID=A0A6A2YCB0_HIBSY|nr:S-adenosyl-L-methionine-dependent methyltransferases superfamily protein isoform 1 [Hibiscus syriacus]
MASPAKISSSSSPSSCKMNSHLKKSELNDPTRRSFSGNPFAKPSVITNRRAFNPTTPANSPSDFPRRHSTSRESVASLPDHGKENTQGSNPKPTSLKSPALSKCKKNFMSPTISAASKINTSPRKQILVERNESVRSSVSLSNVKGLIMEDNESTPEIALQQKKASFSDVKSVIMEDTKSKREIGPNQKKVSFSDVESIIIEGTELTQEISLNQKVSFSDVKSVMMVDTESKPEIGPKQKKVSFSDVESIIIEGTESTPEISLNQKVSFSDVKSVMMEDTESKPEIGPNQKKFSFSDVESIIIEGTESIPDISLNQKVSFSDVKSVIMDDTDSKPEIGSNQKMVTFSDVERTESTPEVSLNQKVTFAFNDSTLPYLTHDSQISHHENEEPLKGDEDLDYKETENDSDLVPETVTEEKDSVNVDPLMVPYDPKTNYLSPRPQFLRYRPNPRIGLLREREGMQLDELFASESYSDNDVTAETPTEGSPRDSEDVSSEETMEEEHDEEKLHVSEPNPSLNDKRMSKPRFPTRSKYITLLLFLSFVCFSVLVVNSPAFTHGIEEISNYQVPQEVSEYAKAYFGRFTRNLQHRSASLLSYVSEIVSGSREMHKLDPIQYANLSRLMEDHMVERQLMFDSGSTEPIWERDAGTELLDDKHYQEIEADEVVDEDDDEQEDQESEASENSELVSEQPDAVHQGIEDEVIESDHLEVEESKEAEFAGWQEAEHQSNVETKNQQCIISPQATEIQHDIPETRDPDGGLNNIVETLFPEEVKSEDLKTEDPKVGYNNIGETLFPEEVKYEDHKNEDSTDNSQSSEAVDIVNGQEEQSINNVTGLALLLCLLLLASAFIYAKREKPSRPNVSMPCQKSECSPVSVDSKDTITEKVSSKNWQTEVDMADESCPSEMMSSYAKSSSYYSNRLKESNEPCPSEMNSSERTSSSYSNKGGKESNQYQSQERKARKTYRRESLASSDYSTGSPSYGSFTTYEKKTSKHGGRDDEIVTPVRRSSRIRNQVTSP